MLKDQEYKIWEQRQIERGINVEWVKEKIKAFKVETPSWGYGEDRKSVV